MKTVKQILQSRNVFSGIPDNNKLRSAVEQGLLDEEKIPILKRALMKEAKQITSVEKKVLNEAIEVLAEMNHLSKFDKRQKAGFPKGDKDVPAVLVLKRKAIRIYPDNQKIALYYSDALDKHFSIPFGMGSDNISLSEEKHEIKGNLKAVKPKKKPAVHTEREMSNSPVQENFRSKLKQKREDKENLNELAPVIPAIVAGARLVASPAARAVASKVLSKGKDVAKSALSKGKDIVSSLFKKKASNPPKKERSPQQKVRDAAKRSRNRKQKKEIDVDLDTDNKENNDKNDKPGMEKIDIAGEFKRTTPSEFGLRAPVDDPRRQQAVRSAATSALDRQELKRQGLVESNLKIVDRLSKTKNKSKKIVIGENTMTINSRVAKKIMNVYNSLNEDNKKKVEEMLNENVTSFKKLINFAIKA